MNSMKFKCTLLSDIILNVKSATEGNNRTLDFIPGNNFLGIAASELYGRISNEQALVFFHSGKVRFGDAHPLIEGIRTLKVPASFFRPKDDSGETLYIHHFYNRDKDKGMNGSPTQLKQCRDGFYAFNHLKGIKATTETSFSIKSAYDTAKRKSLDASMFGYQSLTKGLVFGFEIEADGLTEEQMRTIERSITGIRHLGRSKTAQYGLVKIEQSDYSEPISNTSDGDEITVYADGRLIFMEENGCPVPTFTPTPEQLGLKGGKIIWEKSQIRTFCYAPWNGKRKYYDADRCGIEKGSVFVIKGSQTPESSQYVGSFNNEGFGKVIYNPEFLRLAPDAQNGEAAYRLEEHNIDCTKDTSTPAISSPLLNYLSAKKAEEESEDIIYKKVNDFIERHNGIFSNERFASQWGSIRALATTYPNDCITRISEYIGKGVAKERWDKLNRRGKLEKFMKDINQTDPNLLCRAIVNLASEMAKL